jgi:hypothetical protein
MTVAKAGSLLQIDEGEYSGYGVIGFFVVLQEFDPMAELATYLREPKNPPLEDWQNPDERFYHENFLATLIRKGYLLEIEHGELHLGSGSADDVSFTPTAGDKPA